MHGAARILGRVQCYVAKRADHAETQPPQKQKTGLAFLKDQTHQSELKQGYAPRFESGPRISVPNPRNQSREESRLLSSFLRKGDLNPKFEREA